MSQRSSRLRVLKTIFTNPFYLLLMVVVAIAYYALFYYVVISSNLGLFVVTVPSYMLYSLIITASALMTISIYAVSKAIHAKYAGMEGGAFSIILSSLGTLIVGCNCYAPVLSGIMYAVGFGTLAVGGALSFISIYQIWLIVLLVTANLVFIYYQLGRITRIGGVHRR